VARRSIAPYGRSRDDPALAKEGARLLRHPAYDARPLKRTIQRLVANPGRRACLRAFREGRDGCGPTRKQCDDLWKREALKDCSGRWYLARKRCNLQVEVWYQNLRHGPVSSYIAKPAYRSGQFRSCLYKRNRKPCAALIARRGLAGR
jgi:hypothetical protein